MFYRFTTGIFIEAKTFVEAKEKYLKLIEDEVEDKTNWNACTCLGFTHQPNCSEWVLPY